MDGAKRSLANLRRAVSAHKGAGENFDRARLDELKAEFDEAVFDDLNIPRALGAVWGMAKLDGRNDEIFRAIADADTILALDLDKEPEEEAVNDAADPEADEINALVAERTAAKKAKNYAEADRIRNELTSRGIRLTDTPEGTTWKRE
jgi:cysteinyl-tRNA synthetase